MQLHLYEHSGQNGRAWLMVPLLGLPLLALASAAYSYIAVYIPIAGILTILILGGYVFATGLTLSMLGKVAKCRSRGTMLLLGLGGGLVSLWLAWVFFLYAMINRTDGASVELMELILNPGVMWTVICGIGDNGWYTISTFTPSGVVLWAFWTIETLIIVGGATLIAPTGIDNEMFCEACDRWCAVKETKHLKIEGDLTRAKVEAIDVQQLFTLPKSDAKILPSIRMELLECPSCAKNRGLRFVRLIKEVDKDGKVTEKSETLPGIHCGI